MKSAAIGLTTLLVLASGSFGPARAASSALLVPGYEAAKDLPGACELPDPKTDYKVVFADWGVDNPSFGPARTGDDGLLEIKLVFAKT